MLVGVPKGLRSTPLGKNTHVATGTRRVLSIPNATTRQVHKSTEQQKPVDATKTSTLTARQATRQTSKRVESPHTEEHLGQTGKDEPGQDMQPVQSVLAVCMALLISWSSASGPALARAALTQEEQRTIDIFKTATKSVVSVTNLATKRDSFTMSMLDVPQGAGSGFVYDAQGHVITNAHVIADSGTVKVTWNKDEYLAKVIGIDVDKDIAVLQVQMPSPEDAAIKLASLLPDPVVILPEIQATGPADILPPPTFVPLCLDPEGGLQVGQHVFALGNPFGLDHTLTTGIISGIDREIMSMNGRPIQGVIQTDAAINPGNSGGPLLDSTGCVIGINTAIYSSSGTNAGVGFAIASNVIKSSVDEILLNGKVVRPMLGITFAPDQAVQSLGVQGIMVLSAKEGGPASKAGITGTTRDEFGRLVLGDIIRKVNGTTIKTSSDLYRILDGSKVGDALDVEVLRGTGTQHISITLELTQA